MNVDVGDLASELASERLARRLQEEEDSYAAFHLQSQLDQHGHNHMTSRLVHSPTPHISQSLVHSPTPHISQRLGHISPTVRYVISDEDNDDDVRVVTFLPSDDSDQDGEDDNVIPMSPETHHIVTDALNTAFSSPNTNSDDLMIVSEPVVEDQRPSRRGTGGSDGDDNIVLTVGRSLRSTTAQSTASDNSIVITNNSQTPSANTRSRTRSNTRQNNTESNTRDNTQITDTRVQNRPNYMRSTRMRSNTRQNNTQDNTRDNTQISDTRARNRQNNMRSTRAGAETTPTQDVVSTVTVTASTSPAPADGRQARRSSDVVEIHVSDNQPSTSSGRRAHHRPRQGRHYRHNHQTHGSNISSRVIVNGVPIQLGNLAGGGHLLDQLHAINNFIPATSMFWQGDNSMSYEDMIALDDESTLEPGQGLSKTDINQNTMTKNYCKDASKCSSCNICLNEFNSGEKIRTLPCFHSFHTKCIDNWLTRKPECPVCRSKVGF